MLKNPKVDSVLALTFSNRAVQEMQVRLHQACWELKHMSDKELNTWLKSIGEKPDAPSRAMTRSLYYLNLEK